MGQVKRHGNPWHPIRSEPFIGQPKMGAEEKLSGFEFGLELLNLSRQEWSIEGDTEVVHGKVQELFIGP